MPSRKLPLDLARLATLTLVCGLSLAPLGCRSVSTYSAHPANPPSPRITNWRPTPLAIAADASPGAKAQQLFALATDAQRVGDPRTPDLFYQAAIESWPCLVEGDGGLPAGCAWHIYHTSVAGLITQGERFGRLRCPGGLEVNTPTGPITLTFAGVGIAWNMNEVGRVVVARPSDNERLANYHAWRGFGVPVVAVRQRGACPTPIDRFYAARVPFAATVILRPSMSGTANEESASPTGGTLEFYNPLQYNTVALGGQSFALARDISAPFDFQLQTAENTSMLGFLDPDVPEQAAGLKFLSPYQPGKIPVVFVHGLLADPSTWFNLANDLRTQKWFNDHYQIWAFRYATGKPFITSAMFLRSDLQRAVATLDPSGCDTAMQQMVLVGHSMGGLVAKLQVTYSGNCIWNSFSRVPLEAINASDEVKAGLAQRCFFDPLPFARRVVFIATPHRGSAWAARGVGRISSALVEPAPQIERMHEQLVADNPGVFSKQFQRRVPTSIDMLETSDPTLIAIGKLCIPPEVKLHTILGNGRPTIVEGAGDGVVSVDSAVHRGALSQRTIDATHTSIQRHPDTVREIQCILRAHLEETTVLRNVAREPAE